MFAHEFMRNALIAGSFVGLACGLVGYFVVLRAQVFAGDALSHVAFTGALAAAVFGANILAGLFLATILGGIAIGLLGDRARADDATNGSFFAWTLGIALSVALALVVTWTGLALAYFSIYPVGFYVTSLAFAIYLLVRVTRALASRKRGRLEPVLHPA